MVSTAAQSGLGAEGAPVLEVLDDAECTRLLANGSVGRVAVTVAAIPAIFPVHYAMLGRSVVFRTAPGTTLQAALEGAVVAFEIDDVDAATQCGWSVLVVGRVSELTGDRRAEAMDLALAPWASPGPDHVVAIAPDVITGRRLVRPTGR